MSAVIAQLEELRRQTQRQQVVAGCSIDEQSFREALRRAAPALIEAARVVSEAGDWLCETPIPRIGSNGVAEDWEDWGSCFGCRLKRGARDVGRGGAGMATAASRRRAWKRDESETLACWMASECR
jgi:hypothetical protein